MKIIKASNYTLLSTSIGPDYVLAHPYYQSNVSYGFDVFVFDRTTGKVYNSLINNNRGNALTNTQYWDPVDITWTETRTYPKHFIILDNSSHKFYQSLKDNNTGHSILDKEWWEYHGTMNKWRMFDQYLNTYTIGSPPQNDIAISPAAFYNSNTNGDISFSIDPQGNSSFYIGNMDATSVRVKEIRKSDNVVIIDRTFELYSDLSNWKQYFDANFADDSKKKYLYYHRHSFFDDIKYEITVHNKYGTTKIGIFLVGDEVEFGSTLKGENVQLLDYSTVSKENNGEIFLQKGNFAKSVSLKIHIPSSMADEFLHTVNSMVGEPAVFLPGGNKVTDIYGFVQKQSIDLRSINSSIVSLSIQGLI